MNLFIKKNKLKLSFLIGFICITGLSLVFINYSEADFKNYDYSVSFPFGQIQYVADSSGHKDFLVDYSSPAYEEPAGSDKIFYDLVEYRPGSGIIDNNIFSLEDRLCNGQEIERLIQLKELSYKKDNPKVFRIAPVYKPVGKYCVVVATRFNNKYPTDKPNQVNTSLFFSDLKSVDIEVKVNTAPVADFCFSRDQFNCETNTAYYVGETTYFLDSSEDLEGEIKEWKWDFGDGSAPVVRTSKFAKNTGHNYSSIGQYTAKLFIKDDMSAQESKEKRLSIWYDTAIIDLDCISPLTLGQTQTCTGYLKYYAKYKDNNTLQALASKSTKLINQNTGAVLADSVSSSTGKVTYNFTPTSLGSVSVQALFGTDPFYASGQGLSGFTVVAPADPCAGKSCNDKCSGNILEHSGTCSNGSCVYTETSCAYGCSKNKCNAKPGNNAPVLNPIGNKTYQINSGSFASQSFTVFASDADNDALTFSKTPADDNKVIINSSTGKVVVNTGFIYSKNYTFKVIDGKGGEDSETITIKIQQESAPDANQPPSASITPSEKTITSGIGGSVFPAGIEFTLFASDSDGTVADWKFGCRKGVVHYSKEENGAINGSKKVICGIENYGDTGTHTARLEVTDDKGKTTVSQARIYVPCSCKTWSTVQDGSCGDSGCASNERALIQTQTCSPSIFDYYANCNNPNWEYYEFCDKKYWCDGIDIVGCKSASDSNCQTCSFGDWQDIGCGPSKECPDSSLVCLEGQQCQRKIENNNACSDQYQCVDDLTNCPAGEPTISLSAPAKVNAGEEIEYTISINVPKNIKYSYGLLFPYIYVDTYSSAPSQGFYEQWCGNITQTPMPQSSGQWLSACCEEGCNNNFENYPFSACLDNAKEGQPFVCFKRQDTNYYWSGTAEFKFKSKSVECNKAYKETAILVGKISRSDVSPMYFTSNEVITEVLCPDTALPQVNSFSASPDSITLGETTKISWQVQDSGGSKLKDTKLYRCKSETYQSCPGWGRPIAEYANINSDGPENYSKTDTPPETGTYWYGVHVSDNAGNYVKDSKGPIKVSVHASNSPPVLNPIGSKAIQIKKELKFEVTASDPDNDPLNFTAENLPAGSSFEYDAGGSKKICRWGNWFCYWETTPSGWFFKWTPLNSQTGEYNNIVFRVNDNKGGQDSETITITAKKINKAPNKPSNPLPAQGAKDVSRKPLFSWTGSDPDNDPLQYYIGYCKSLSSSCVPSLDIGPLSESQYTALEPLDPGSMYWWRVKAFDGELSSTSSYWYFYTDKKDIEPPVLPGSFTLSGLAQNCEKIKLNWTKSQDAETYTIRRKLPNSGYIIRKKVDSNILEYIDDAVQDNTNYEYNIKASNSAGSTLSNNIAVQVPECDARAPQVNDFYLESNSSMVRYPSSLSIIQGDNLTINWKVSDNQALDYVQIWRSTSDCSNWQEDGSNISQSGKSDSGQVSRNLETGAYCYGIHVIDKAGIEETETNNKNHGITPKGPIKVNVLPKLETDKFILKVVAGFCERADLTWGKAENALGYRVQRRAQLEEGWSNWIQRADTRFLSFGDAVQEKTTYQYKVQAYNQIQTIDSNIEIAETPACPRVSCGNGSVEPEANETCDPLANKNQWPENCLACLGPYQENACTCYELPAFWKIVEDPESVVPRQGIVNQEEADQTIKDNNKKPGLTCGNGIINAGEQCDPLADPNTWPEYSPACPVCNNCQCYIIPPFWQEIAPF